MLIPNNCLSNKHQSIITRFDPTENSWTKLGNMNWARYAQGVIQVDNEFIVVGGWGSGYGDFTTSYYSYGVSVPTESCKLNGDSMTCIMREPKLFAFFFYPELMLIE